MNIKEDLIDLFDYLGKIADAFFFLSFVVDPTM